MAHKFPINLSQFKKVHDAEDHAVLQHPAGHEFKVAKKALSAKMRGELERLPMAMQHGGAQYAEGGEAEEHPIGETAEGKPRSSITLSSGPMKGHTIGLDTSSKPAPEPEHRVKESKKPSDESGRNPINYPQGASLAEGGEISDDEIIKQKAEVDEYNKTHGDEPKEYPDAVEKRMRETDVTPRKYADGGEADSEDSAAPAPQSPVNINIGAAPQAPPPTQGGMAQAGMPVATSPQALSPSMAPTDQQPAATPQPAQQQPQGKADEQQPSTPTVMGGYAQQVKGITGEAAAEQSLAREQASIAKGQAQAGMELMNKYQQHYDDLNQEYQNTMDDIRNQHIDPNHYLGSMTSGQKFDTAVGLILGGMGGMGQGNQALDFLNRQIDRDIEAQKAELGKRETLLSANLRQFGNMRDATEMTKAMMNGIAASKFQAASAKAASPLAKARADQMMGQLQQQVGPSMQTLAMRQMLMTGQGGPGTPSGSMSQQDPASFVPYVVPAERQKDVFNEIKTAQDTRAVAKTILENFDKVAAQMKSGGGLGRVGVGAYEPAELQALEAELGTTVGQKEGTVRETAMQNVKNAYKPRVNDTDERLAARRKELERYLTLQSAAPTAKSFGIDIDKFGSTSRRPEARLAPEEQQLVQRAQERLKANPGDIKAQMVLKKLGIQ